MNFKRIGRALVCLLLVCCLCFNMVTVPAKAAVATSTLISVGLVATAILIGLGPRPGEAADDFNMAIHGFTQFLEDTTTWVKDGCVQVWKDVTGKYYVEESMIDTLWNWLFDSGVVSTAVSVPDNVNALDLYNESFSVCSSYSFAFVTFASDGRWAMGYSNGDNPCFIADGGSWIISNASGAGTVTSPSNSSITNISSWGGQWRNSGSVALLDSVSFFGSSAPDVVTSQDLILQSLVAPSVSIATGYADWAAGAISIPGIGATEGTDEEDYVRAYPLGMGQTMEETQSMLQTDVQAGTGTYTDTATDTEVITGTFADTAVGAFINSLIDALWTPFRWIGEKLDLLGQLLSDVVSGVISIPEALSALWTSVIVEPIIEGISVIFVPQSDFLTGKVVELQAQFPHITPIIEVGQFIGNQMSGFDTSPPIIYIDLGATRGSYDIGGKVAFIDMTWYAEYKPTVDTFLSALLWIVFWWKMFKRLPGLISGMPGDFVMDGLHNIGLADHLPSRNAAYEIQRRDNHNSVWRRR